MLQHKFIICSPGRTGSIMIARALSTVLHKEVKYIDETKSIDNNDWIVHNHNTRLTVPDKQDWILIISRRRDDFKGVISHLIAEITNEYNTYSNQKIPQVHIPVESFVKIWQQRNNFYKQLDLNNYYTVLDIYLEDMLQYPYYLFKQLGQQIKMPIKTSKCPYGSEIISNFKELEEYYQNNVDSHP